jgi:HEAT repeat protein
MFEMSLFFDRIAAVPGMVRRELVRATYILGNHEMQMAALLRMGRSGDLQYLPFLINALGPRNHDIVRAEAIRALAELKAAEATVFLIELLEDSSEIVQEEAARALGMISDERAIQAIASMLKHPSDVIKMKAADSIARLGEKGIGWVGELLKKSSFDTRIAAAYALGQMRHPKAFAALERDFADSDAAVRREVAASIANQGAEFAAQVATHLSDLNPLARQTAAMALTKLQTNAAVGALFARLEQETDSEVLEWIWEALAASRYEPARKRLLVKKSILKSDFRQLTAMGADAVEPLIESFRAGDFTTRKVLETVLLQVGNADEPRLIRALSDRDQSVRRLAVRLLGSFDWKPASEFDLMRLRIAAGKYSEAATTAAVPILAAMLHDAESGEREMATETLGTIKDCTAADALSIAAGDESARVRERAAEALGNFSTERSASILERLAGDPHQIVSAAASKAIRTKAGLRVPFEQTRYRN